MTMSARLRLFMREAVVQLTYTKTCQFDHLISKNPGQRQPAFHCLLWRTNPWSLKSMLLQWLTIKTIRSEIDLNKKTTSPLLVSDDNSDFSETPKVNIVWCDHMP